MGGIRRHEIIISKIQHIQKNFQHLLGLKKQDIQPLPLIDRKWSVLENSSLTNYLNEATGGFEPPNKGFADLSLNHLGTSPFTNNFKDSAQIKKF